MGVLGAYSNHETQERLRRLAEKLDRLAASGASPRPTTRRDCRLPSGLLPEAIMQVLGDAGKPMRVRDVHAVVEQLLGRPVSPSAVKTWLARHAVGERATVMRLGRGRYVPTRGT
jgi:hypothetical protein